MGKANRIRILALGLIADGDRLFLSQGYDLVKQQTFYRAMGGGVDFGETSYDALKREFQEEIQAELTNIKYLSCLESIFTFNGKPYHEIIQLYQCDFADQNFYQLDELIFIEGDREKPALWVDIPRCKSGELRVVPETFLTFI
ncbi:MAG: NUDIX hydrolase [Kastovskya adunca ATA6-11-RM4]|jgi:8-oxo-dGTP pyrophosphatase MutT (NUDIX family)|nr:NUDIX hydrolase [Kastovskya adunca ATA6-11-RM4]